MRYAVRSCHVLGGLETDWLVNNENLSLMISCIQIRASNGHPIICIIVVAALVFQPIGGLLHHRLYAKYGKKTIWGVGHLWWGRVFVTLGIINGGLGLMLAGNTRKGEIAFGVIAGVVWCVWLGVVVGNYFRRRGGVGKREEKGIGRREGKVEDEGVA